MNKEDHKKLIVTYIILGLGLLGAILIGTKIYPNVQRISSLNKNIKSSQATLNDETRKLEVLKKNQQKQEEEIDDVYKAFFSSNGAQLDTEATLGLEFSEILESIRKYKVKTRSIKYDYNPADDNFVKNMPGSYQVCRVSMEMVAKYSEFKEFLRDLYAHPHFLEISKIEIAPYMKNKRILLINLQIKIYARKD